MTTTTTERWKVIDRNGDPIFERLELGHAEYAADVLAVTGPVERGPFKVVADESPTTGHLHPVPPAAFCLTCAADRLVDSIGRCQTCGQYHDARPGIDPCGHCDGEAILADEACAGCGATGICGGRQ